MPPITYTNIQIYKCVLTEGEKFLLCQFKINICLASTNLNIVKQRRMKFKRYCTANLRKILCVDIYLYTHTHTYTYIHTHTHIYTCIYIHTYIYKHTYTHIPAHTYTHIYSSYTYAYIHQHCK